MGIQVDNIYFWEAADGLQWPEISWTGMGIKRRAMKYGETWYAEYACWDLTDGVSWTVGEGGYTADFWMISPGETGKPGNGSGCGQGGGAGVPLTTSGIELGVGTYTFVLSQTGTSAAGPFQNSNTIIASTPTNGYPVGSVYRLYGDTAHEYGTVTAGLAATAATPGRGATGCTFLPVKAPDTVYGYNSTKIYMMTASPGVGAGGNGGARTDYCSTYLGSLVNAGLGAAGLILMRTPLVR
ncbi:hypothetical protein AGMMS49992_08280 [Clostridia bacterium]|nr:hypothetical protein AGMMS49992_08280 [Clostridia bacterium]